MKQNDAVIFMIEIAGAGGIAHYTYNLLKHFDASCRAILYTGCPYEMADLGEGIEYQCVFRRLKTNPFRVIKLFFDALRLRPAAVHMQLSQYPVFVLVLIAVFRMLGIRVITTAHNVLPHERSRWQPAIFRAIYGLSQSIVVHSLHSRNELVEMLDVPEDRIHVIDHGNYLFFNSGGQPEPRQDEGLRILFFGYIRPYKGLSVLLEALALLKASGDKFCLSIVGRPVEPFEPYEQMIEQYGLSEYVAKHLGYVPMDEVGKHFASTDVVALPYINISQSGVLQLAYAFGKPVIVTRTGGLPEVVVEGESGYVVPPGESEPLAQRLRALARDPARARKMGEYARDLSQSKYSWQHIAPLNQRLYGIKA